MKFTSALVPVVPHGPHGCRPVDPAHCLWEGKTACWSGSGDDKCVGANSKWKHGDRFVRCLKNETWMMKRTRRVRVGGGEIVTAFDLVDGALILCREPVSDLDMLRLLATKPGRAVKRTVSFIGESGKLKTETLSRRLVAVVPSGSYGCKPADSAECMFGSEVGCWSSSGDSACGGAMSEFKKGDTHIVCQEDRP